LKNIRGFVRNQTRESDTQLVMLEVILTKRGRARWEWRVMDSTGRTIMGASESSRPEAKYQGERALFLLLMTTARALDPVRHKPQTPQGPQPAR
jgi:hypothetical protein